MEQIYMKELNDLDINTCCRACLENQEVRYNIFELPDISVKFTACTSLSIDPDDGLPIHLCERCCSKIEDFYYFKQMSISAAQRFLDNIQFEKKPNISEFEIANDSSSLASLKLENENQIKDEKEIDLIQGDYEQSYQIIQINEAAGSSNDSTKLLEDFKVKEESKDTSFEEGANSSKDTNDVHRKSTQKLTNEESCSYTNSMKTTRPKTSLRQDVAKKHSNRNENSTVLFVCEICGKVLKTPKNLEKHQLLHDGKFRKHECPDPQCRKTFITNAELVEHINKHTGTKKYACPYCKIKKSSRIELQKHINYHTKEKMYPCLICNRIFFSEYTVARHKQVVHQGIREFHCSYCDKTFASVLQRNSHQIKIHIGEGPFACEICNKTFTLQDDLKKHTKIQHTEIKCDTCGREFNHRAHLRSHQEIVHEGKREFSCSHCSKTFGTAATRNTHEKIHTNDRQHECKTCGKKFITVFALRQHTLIHTGLRPHKCDVCEKNFINLSALNRHRKIHSKN